MCGRNSRENCRDVTAIGPLIVTFGIETMRMPAVVIAVVIVYSDGTGLTISCGLRAAAMLRRGHCEGSQKQHQH